ncbi:MAG: ATP-dependent helicase RecG, partial [Daejeonella sp.]|nr:ATP-dependent helicase RecG [Daejeonella sp.]
MQDILKTPIEYLKGVGTQRADVLKKELEVYIYQDLLFHYPFRYIDRTKYYKIKDLTGDLPAVQVLVRVFHKEIIGEKHAKRLVVKVKDDTGSIELVWFQSVNWIERNITIGAAYIVFGKPTVFNSRISISHPELELYNPKVKREGNITLQPVYNSTEKLKMFSLDTKGLQKLQASLLDVCIDHIQESLPDYILIKH